MATEKRTVVVYGKVKALPVNQAKGRRPGLLSRMVDVIFTALPVYDKLQEARAAFKDVSANMDAAIAQAGALFAIEVFDHIMPDYKDATSPYAVWQDIFKAQWSAVTEEILKRQGITQQTPEDERKEAASHVAKLRGAWSRAQLVMFHADKRVLASFAKGDKPAGLQAAYKATQEKLALASGKEPSPARIQAIAETVLKLTPTAREKVLAIIRGTSTPMIAASPAKGAKVAPKGRKRQVA